MCRNRHGYKITDFDSSTSSQPSPRIFHPKPGQADYLSVVCDCPRGYKRNLSSEWRIVPAETDIFRRMVLADRLFHCKILCVNNGRRASERIRLMLLHPQMLFRTSLARLLSSERDFELVAECSNLAEAMESLTA